MNKQFVEVLVLGMHRSGTSMVSGVLNRLGVDMGDDLPGRQVTNPMGHFEDGDFLSLNESILAKAGGSWDKPPSSAEIQSQADLFEEDLQRITNLKAIANQKKSWGWKDPRTSLTARLYLPFLINPRVIWCQRDPVDIANSLWKRNKFIHQESNLLTEHYQAQIREFIEEYPDIPVLKVKYKDIVSDPEFWIQKMVDFLELDPNEDQFEEAWGFVLPRKIIEKEKKKFWWKNQLSLPIRLLRKIGIIAE